MSVVQTADMSDEAPLTLPDWLVSTLPPVQPHGRLDAAGETAVVYTAPDMTEHYHDPYLDAVGATFEEAVLALAHNVAVTFNDDGSETGERPANSDADELYATVSERMDPLQE